MTLAACGGTPGTSVAPVPAMASNARMVAAASAITTAGTWSKKHAMITAGYFLGLATDTNAMIYASAASQGAGSKELQVYDPATNAWTKGTPMKLAVEGPASAAINGTVYVAGGYAGGKAVATLQAYDESTNTWTGLAKMPTPRFAPAAAVINGILYVVGGAAGNTSTSTPSNALQSYNPATNTWTKLASMPTARGQLAAAALNGEIYAIAGNDGASNNAVEVYNPATNTWAKKNPFPVSDAGLAAAVVNGTLYAVGGNLTYGGLWSYNATTDTWTQLPSMPYPRYGLGAVSDGNLLYAIGGYDAAASKYISDISVYTP
jgi:N-acetylneuraminic acid mutarotase